MTSIVKKPEWKEEGGVYFFGWDSLNVYIEINRISTKDKVLFGEVQISRRATEGTQLIEKTRLDLLSEKARDSFSSTLSKRNKDIDWLSILKYVCIITVDHYRQGEPLGYLGGIPPTMDITYQVFPLLKFNEPTTIFADGGTGKSYLASYIAVLTQHGELGFYIRHWDCTIFTMSCNVLYLDWEATYDDHLRRVWAIKKGLGIEDNKETILYQRCTQPLVDILPETKKIIKENQVGLIIIDSQVAASEGESDKADGARKYYNALRYLNCTSLTLDHVPKGNGLIEPKKPYGSGFKWNLSRSQFELKKYQTPGENKIQLALYHRKSNEGMLIKPFGYQIEFVNDDKGVLDRVLFTGIDIPEELASGESNNITSRVRKVITMSALGKMTSKNISLVLKVNESLILKVLNENHDTFAQKDNQWFVVANEYEN